VTDLNNNARIGSFDVRRVIDIIFHPKYKPGKLHYDVGIALASKTIEFTDYIRPVCLPYLPIDNDNRFKEEAALLVGWQEDLEEVKENPPTPKLKLQNLKVSHFC
jgi:hypothetical protein